MGEERVMRITHLRDNLGWAYRLVVETDEPVVVQRYKAQDVMLVPAWEWRFLKQVEADIRAGRCPWEDGTGDHQKRPETAHEESFENPAELA